jgi:fused signal recognition particle receptor
MAFHFFKKKPRPAPERETPAEAVVDRQSTAPPAAEATEKKQPAEEVTETQPPATDRRPEPEAPATQPTQPPSSGGFYQRLRNGLSKTRRILTTDIDQLFSAGRRISQEMLDDLEERLITADIGVQTSMEIIEELSRLKNADAGILKTHLRNTLLTYLTSCASSSDVSFPGTGPRVILVVGVNGVGKTTTIGKMAAQYIQAGNKVIMVAADTFRAAAVEQLAIWAQRTGADLIRHRDNADPAAVVFDGLEAARARGADIVLIDTAGRLHTKTNLMEELKKIKRTITKQIPEAPHEVLLVLDATTGQNALSQAEMFIHAAGVTGLVLTKLDGTAKGGMVVNLCRTFQIPLRFIGIGEQIDDLQFFEPEKFVEALF